LDFAESPEADSLDVFNGHYFQLLVAELLYKNDYGQSNRPELLRAVAYFDSLVAVGGADARGVSVWPFQRRDASNASAKTTAFLAARAHYINGVGYYERDSVVEACKEYIKALETMEGHFAEKELTDKQAQFMALTYTRLADLYSDMYLHEQAIYFAKLSLQHYNKYQALPWHMAWILEEIGTHYDMMEQLDSAYSYYQKAGTLLNDNKLLICRDIAARKALLAYKMESHPEEPLEQLCKLLTQAESEKEFLTRCSLVGEIYYHEKQFDSAQVYLNQVFQNTDNQNLKRQAAKLLVNVYKVQGRETEISEYVGFLAPFATIDEDNSTTKSQLTELYKTFIQEQLERTHRKVAYRHLIYVLAVVAGMLFVILIISLLYHKNKKHKHHLETLIESERQAHKIQQEALSGKLKKNNEVLRLRKEEAENLRKELKTQQKQKAWSGMDEFLNEDICRTVLDLFQEKEIKREAKRDDYPELHLSISHLSQLNIAVEKHFHGFGMMLADFYPKISPDEMNQCLLYLLNLQDVQIAALLNCDYSTIKKRAAKLKKVFGTEKELLFFIRGFVL